MSPNAIEKIDLHMHTCASDGTDTPAEIISHVREEGIQLFSVTDHDTVRGCCEVINKRAEGDPHFFSGVEFSCKDGGGKYHILGYGYDVNAEGIQRLVKTTHELRMEKVRERIRALTEEYGFHFPAGELQELFSHDEPGKPHIGNMMTRLGYTKSKDEAIYDFLNKIKVKSRYIRPEDAIQGILESGGIPILAHPVYGSGEELYLGEEMEQRLRHLLEQGIQGVEAYYSGFTKPMQDLMLDLADKYRLYVTAGSDYHGRNKLVLLGDTNLESVSGAHPGLHRFLHAVSEKIY